MAGNLEVNNVSASIREIRAIDVHAHYGTFYRDGFTDLRNRFFSGDAKTVLKRARAANTDVTVVSPLLGLFPRSRSKARVEEANEEAARVVEENDGLRQWVIIDPRREKTYRQAEQMLKMPKCVGIKIHGEEHTYYLDEHGEAIFAFAAKHKAVMLAHSGCAHTMPMEFVPFADQYPEVKLIVAHLGHTHESNGDPTNQVRAILASRHGNIYTDTSSMKSIMPQLIEWAVDEVGANKLLYGTDAPLYFSPNQRARIDHAEISDQQKHMILRENAVNLLRLDVDSTQSDCS